MEKLKDIKNKKHDHILTRILKVSIFSLIMLAPMFAIAAKCMYVAFNKNAKDSYSNQVINVEKQLTTLDDLNRAENLYYLIKLNGQDATEEMITNYQAIQYTNPQFIGGNATETTINKINTSTELMLYYNISFRQVRLTYPTQTRDYDYYDLRITDWVIKVDTLSVSLTAFNDWSVYLYRVYEQPYQTLDDVFYNSVEQIGNEQIFSWTKNTGIYTAINTMTTGLGIDPTNNILAILLTYWTLNTIVYIIIDIVIELFTKLTHMI